MGSQEIFNLKYRRGFAFISIRISDPPNAEFIMQEDRGKSKRESCQVTQVFCVNPKLAKRQLRVNAGMKAKENSGSSDSFTFEKRNGVREEREPWDT